MSFIDTPGLQFSVAENLASNVGATQIKHIQVWQADQILKIATHLAKLTET